MENKDTSLEKFTTYATLCSELRQSVVLYREMSAVERDKPSGIALHESISGLNLKPKELDSLTAHSSAGGGNYTPNIKE